MTDPYQAGMQAHSDWMAGRIQHPHNPHRFGTDEWAEFERGYLKAMEQHQLEAP